MNWLSLAAISANHTDAPSKAMKELNDRWNHTPSAQELDILQQNLRSYLQCMDDRDSADHRKIVEGILAEPEFLNRAIIVSDGSYLALRIYAYMVRGKVRMMLDSEYEEAQFDPRVCEYLWDRKHSVEETLEWILKNYQTIPFQCGTLSQLETHEQFCNEMRDHSYGWR